MREKWIGSILLCAILMLALVSGAYAQSYNFHGVIIDIPSDMEVMSADNQLIEVEINSISQVRISVDPTEAMGIDKEFISMIGEEFFLEYVASILAEGLDVYSSEITELADRKCYVVNSTTTDYDMTLEVNLALTLAGENLVSVWYVHIIEVSGREFVDPDEKTLENIMGWISESSAQDEWRTDAELSDNGTVEQFNVYEMLNGDLVFCLDENKMNIFTDNNEEKGLSLSRTGYEKTQMDLYVSLSSNELFILPLGAKDSKISIAVSVKEDKYSPNDSFLTLSEAEWNLTANALAAGFGVTEYETIERDDVRYCVFDWHTGMSYQKRYATMHNGSMIYIYASRDGEELSQEDISLLIEVVESAEYH